MTRPGIETKSPKPLANILLIRPLSRSWNKRLFQDEKIKNSCLLNRILVSEKAQKCNIQRPEHSIYTAGIF